MPYYREYAPSSPLRPYVECYWTSSAPADDRERRVLPDGCIDILFSFTSSLARARIIGTMTRPFLATAGELQRIAAIRFRAGGATPFLLLPAHELTDAQAELSEAWRDHDLTSRLEEAQTDELRVGILEATLLDRLPTTRSVDHRVAAAVSLLQNDDVESAARSVNVTRQHLNRLFRAEVGIGPKQFERVLRMQRLQTRLRRAPAPDWAALALDAGYCDQSHMIREHKALTGLTPAMFHFSKTQAAP